MWSVLGIVHVQVSKLLQYSPLRRLSALQALTHPFFNELREAGTMLPNGETFIALPLALDGHCNHWACSLQWRTLPFVPHTLHRNEKRLLAGIYDGMLRLRKGHACRFCWCWHATKSPIACHDVQGRKLGCCADLQGSGYAYARGIVQENTIWALRDSRRA